MVALSNREMAFCNVCCVCERRCELMMMIMMMAKFLSFGDVKEKQARPDSEADIFRGMEKPSLIACMHIRISRFGMAPLDVCMYVHVTIPCYRIVSHLIYE